jgi:hypothetical protein
VGRRRSFLGDAPRLFVSPAFAADRRIAILLIDPDLAIWAGAASMASIGFAEDSEGALGQRSSSVSYRRNRRELAPARQHSCLRHSS